MSTNVGTAKHVVLSVSRDEHGVTGESVDHVPWRDGGRPGDQVMAGWWPGGGAADEWASGQ